MAHQPTIRVDARAPMTEEKIPFFTFCVDWAQKLEGLLAGISMEISIADTWAQANYRWQGKNLVIFMTDHISNWMSVRYLDSCYSAGYTQGVVEKDSVWANVLRPILRREIEKIKHEWSEKLRAVDYYQTK